MEAIEALFIVLIFVAVIGGIVILILPAIVWAFIWTMKILCIVIGAYIIYRIIRGILG